MATSVPAPSIDWSSPDLEAAMSKFIRSCHLHFAGPLQGKEEAVKMNYLLIWSGTDGQDIADTFVFANNGEKTLENPFIKFEAYVKPRSNISVARYELLLCHQQPDEAADAYLISISRG